MGGLSIWHIIVLAAIALLLFGGRGKISDVMGDFARGIRSFRKGLAEDDQPAPRPQIPEERRDQPPPVMNKDSAAHS
jgi:sec-independent protein translocase protein TatA